MIRHAQPSDMGELLRMGKSFWALTDYDVPFDPISTRNIMEMCMSQDLCMVLDIDGVVGFVMGVKFPLMYNRAYTIGAELAWWVDKEHRGRGKELLKAIEVAAKEGGVDFWTMMNLENLNPEIAEKIYINAGYQKTESTFLKVF